MTHKLIYSLILFIWVGICFIVWRRQRDKDWLWFSWIGVGGGCLQLAGYVLNDIIQASALIQFVINSLIVIFNAIGILLLARIIFKSLFGRKD